MITGLWVGPNQYKVSDSERNKSEVVMIPTTDIAGRPVYDMVELHELEHFARDQASQRFKQPIKEPLTGVQRRDLGGVLKDIKSSRDHRRESLHARYWKGAA